jgi:hypothetical protein
VQQSRIGSFNYRSIVLVFYRTCACWKEEFDRSPHRCNPFRTVSRLRAYNNLHVSMKRCFHSVTPSTKLCMIIWVSSNSGGKKTQSLPSLIIVVASNSSVKKSLVVDRHVSMRRWVFLFACTELQRRTVKSTDPSIAPKQVVRTNKFPMR